MRALRAVGRDPIFVERGEGPWLIDVDGARYLDYVCSWGPLIAGHAHPAVVAAVTEAAKHGTSYGAPTAGEVDLAAELTRRIPSIEMVRATSSGTEAAMSALRLARAATGRDGVLKFAGAYHGHADGLLAQAGSGLATQAIPASPGVTAAQAADTAVVAWNDREAIEQALAERAPAAIVCEPYPANMGLVPPAEGFLAFLRERADAAGALLIFDEVISGFRVGPAGAQGLEGVEPDLTVLGKVIGGGLPAAAYAGPRELMELVAPVGNVYQAGTLAGNPLATAAGLATLGLLDEPAYEALERTTRTLAEGLAEAARAAGVALQVPFMTGLLCVFFSETPVTDYEGARAADGEAFASFWRAMLDAGVYLPPSPFEAWFPSLAHEPEHVEATLDAAAAALRAL